MALLTAAAMAESTLDGFDPLALSGKDCVDIV